MITQRDLECEIKELQLEIEDHQKAIGKIKDYLKRKELHLKEMTNQQPLDIIEIDGVKYQRVEEPKPTTLYEALHEVYYGTTYVHKEEICGVVEKWLPAKVIEDGEDYNKGWNDCLQYLQERIK